MGTPKSCPPLPKSTMRFILALVFSCCLAYAQGESCMISTDCMVTICADNSAPICSRGFCTCVSACTETNVRCFTADQCIRDDPCRNNGGCARVNGTGRPDYHCYDNRCWCGVPNFS